MSTIGTVDLHCTVNGESTRKLSFHIVDKKVKTLLGLRDVIEMGLVKLDDEVHEVGLQEHILHEYSDVFNDKKLGKLPVTYKMKLDPNVTLVVRPPHRIPLAIKEKVKKELDSMVERGIITPVTEPTEWVSSMVAAKKKNKEELRICIDPKNLNVALQRPHHPMRTIEEVVANIAGAQIYSTLDAKTGFWQISMDEKSSYYTTFATPFGRYRFLRMPYGIKSGSEVFQ